MSILESPPHLIAFRRTSSLGVIDEEEQQAIKNQQHINRENELQNEQQQHQTSAIKDYSELLQFKIVWDNLSFKVDDVKESWFVPQWTQPKSQRKRVIFENLSGYIKSGEISAILGPSGAGKTSLLNAITGFASSRGYSGTIRLVEQHSLPPSVSSTLSESSELPSESFRKFSKVSEFSTSSNNNFNVALIPQKDKLLESLTVRENIMFASRIKNCGRHQRGHHLDHENQLEKLASILNLTVCLDTLASNCSGGEYKRVSIAQELTNRPDILVLDEPTSGLDSLNCKNLIVALKHLCQSSQRHEIDPLAILVTIHQPQVDVFHTFDHVYVMARHGRVIFDGRPQEALEQVHTTLGPLAPRDVRRRSIRSANDEDDRIVNPAAYLIELASGEYGEQVIDILSRQQEINVYRELIDQHSTASTKNVNDASTTTNVIEIKINGGGSSGNTTGITTITNDDNCSDVATSVRSTFERDSRLNGIKQANNWLDTMRVIGLLSHRTLKVITSDYVYLLSAVAFNLLIPFVMYALFSPATGKATACPDTRKAFSFKELLIDSATQQSELAQRVFDRHNDLDHAIETATLFLVLLVANSLNGAAMTAAQASVSVPLTVKEYRNNWYSIPVFVTAQTLASYPIELTFPMLSSMLSYWLLGHPSSVYMWRSILIAFVIGLVSLISRAQGFTFGTLFSWSTEAAMVVSIGSVLPMFLYNGLTGSLADSPTFVKIVSWLSMHRLAMASIMSARFGLGTCSMQCELDTTEGYTVFGEDVVNDRAHFVDVPVQLESMARYHMGQTRHWATNDSRLGSDIHKFGGSPTIELAELRLAPEKRAAYLDALANNNSMSLFDRVAWVFSSALSYGEVDVKCDTARSFAFRGRFADDKYVLHEIALLFVLLIVWKLASCWALKYNARHRSL